MREGTGLAELDPDTLLQLFKYLRGDAIELHMCFYLHHARQLAGLILTMTLRLFEEVATSKPSASSTVSETEQLAREECLRDPIICPVVLYRV